MAALHWLAALAFGLALTTLLEVMIVMPRPPTAPSGFGFPSMQVTMATVTFGFFAILIARELPGRSRVWPYLVAASVIATLGFARLYLGAHWLSDSVGGVLLGVVWLLLLGLAYRRHVARSFWMRPPALIFYATFAIAALWHAPRAVEPLLARFHPPEPALSVSAQAWWDSAWASLPAHRNERSANLRWPLDVQVAGPLEPLRTRLEAQGWSMQPQADWFATLNLLDDDLAAAEQPILPATVDARAEALLMRRNIDTDTVQVLRLWRAPLRLDEGQPLWVGTTQTLVWTQPLWGLFNLWRPVADQGAAFYALRDGLAGFETAEAVHPQSGVPVLRVRVESTAAVRENETEVTN